MISTDFQSILVTEDNKEQNSEEGYTNRYKKHIAFSYGNKFVRVDNKSSKPFKTYSGKDVV